MDEKLQEPGECRSMDKKAAVGGQATCVESAMKHLRDI